MSLTPELEKREYNISDPYMLEFAKDIHTFATEDLADLVTFDPDFVAAFLTAYELAINDAEAVPSDEQVENVITQMTEDVEVQMGVCRKKYQDAKYFIERAFPKDKATWDEFGYDRYNKARNIQPKLIEFMRDFHGAAVKHAAQLGTVNYTAALILDIKTQTDLLDSLNRAQNAYANNRPQITKERILKHNAVWNTATRICTAGKTVYQDNYAKFKRYLLPASDETEQFILKGKVTQPGVGPVGTPALPVEDVTVSLMGLPGVITQTDSNGNYGFTSIAAGTYSVEFNKVGYMPSMQPGVVITDMDNPVTLNVVLIPMP